MFSRLLTFATLGALSLTACVLPQPPGANDSQAPSLLPADAKHYVLLKADETQLVNVANDRTSMFLTFGIDVPAAMQFFDGDGKPLKHLREASVAAVPGLHSGLLVKLGKSLSFVAVRTGAALEGGPRVTETPVIARLREAMLADEPARKAMQRAIAGLETGNEAVAADFKDTAKAAQVATIPPVTIKLSPVEQDAQKKAAIDWKAKTSTNLPSSAMEPSGVQGYITFVDDSFQPVRAKKVVDAVRSLAAGPGVLLISGITSANASADAITLAGERAAFIQSILIQEGIAQDKLTLTAVFRTDSHVRKNPARPIDTVGVTWLPGGNATKSDSTKKLSSR